MVWGLLLVALGAEPDAESVRFFESQVRPVLAEHCWNCHGSKKQWAGLRLDSAAGLRRGGESGPAVVPGKVAESRLVQAIRRVDESLQMPPERPLPAAAVAVLEKWVAAGAPFPESPGVAPSRPRDHWSFRPPQAQPLPRVADTTWPANGIDYFILAKLEELSLTPAPPAEPRELLRRVTYDLTGLPPTPEEVNEFLADPSPAAYERLVDRLLSSPAYGERWGRHWLDVARYADSNGLDENIAHGNAWRYRDYVVAALNADKPFDRFVREQLAGDLLVAEDKNSSEAARHERLIATGLLSIGPKVLAEVDQAKMRMDIVDEQIEAVGRVFLGLTLGCARCHDHKFDPIDMTDYYGLAGVFKSTKTMDTYTKVAKWHEHSLATPAEQAARQEYDTRLAALKKELADFQKQADEMARRQHPAGQPPPEKWEQVYPEASKAELQRLRDALAALEKTEPELPSAMGVTEDSIADVPLHLRGDPQKLGEVVPRRTPAVLVSRNPIQFTAAESGRRQLAEWLLDPHQPLTARVLVNRVWRWHFGRGLVRTTDNLGVLGETPSHPELLDWLAIRVAEDGWSWKRLQRLMVLSSTYRQASRTAAEASSRHDQDNRWWSRFGVRRLSAEEIRDALLAVSGQLDRACGGPCLKVKNRGYLFDHTSIDRTDYTSRRRSLYLPVIRNHVYDVFQLLDFPDPAIPSGDRATTTVAPQALLFLNSPFVMDAADALAERAQRSAADEPSRLRWLYQQVYSRSPSAAEEAQASQFLREAAQQSAGLPATGAAGPAISPEQVAWGMLAHSLLAANEFIYLQ